MEILDSVLINWILPLVALGILMAYNRGTTDKEKEAGFVDKERLVSDSMYPHWLFVLKWLAPAVIVVGMLLQVIGLKLTP